MKKDILSLLDLEVADFVNSSVDLAGGVEKTTRKPEETGGFNRFSLRLVGVGRRGGWDGYSSDWFNYLSGAGHFR